MAADARNTAKPQAPTGHSANRLAPLDGLRAIAILWVMVYHYFDFWTPSGYGMDVLPYGDFFFGFPLASAGWMGVSLFFMVSGFVILMTLERTSHLIEFAIRRVARIFPTLMMCGLITWIVSLLIGPPAFKVGIGEFLFSIFSLPPEHFGKLLGYNDWQWLDGAYWSLWVELRFYAVIGILYFVFRSAWIPVWFVFQALAGLLMIGAYATDFGTLDRIGSLIFYEYVPLFSIGVVAYLMFSRGRAPWMIWAMAFSVIHVSLNSLFFKPFHSVDLTFIVGHVLMLILFAAAFLLPLIQKALSWNPLVKIGRASYSFYLLHQVLGISILHGLATIMPMWSVATIALPLTMIILIGLSLVIYERYEQPLNRGIVKRFTSKRERASVSSSKVRG